MGASIIPTKAMTKHGIFLLRVILILIWNISVFRRGLSLEQAPPIKAVLRFFITLPVFGLILSCLMIFFPAEILTPSHPFSLSAVHLLFLGIVSMGMIGALFQMQSVLGGAPIPQPLGNSLIIHTLFTLGTLALVGAFIFGIRELFVIASVFLGSAIVYFAQILLPLLFGKITHDTLKGMRLAIFSLFVTAILGIVMASSYASQSFSDHHAMIRASHYSMALIGWIAMLIMYVAFQVVEMFYVTTPYSDWCKHNIKKILVISLSLKIIWLFAALPFEWFFDMIIVSLLVGFMVTTTKRLYTRKRRVGDISVWFWFAGMGLLGVSLGTYCGSLIFGYASLEIMSLMAFGLFALSVILGMMGKIIPFLVWFHLNASGFMETPVMSNIIPQKRLKITFWLFISTALFTLISPLYPMLLTFAGVSGMVTFGILFFNILTASKLYYHISKNGTKFRFNG